MDVESENRAKVRRGNPSLWARNVAKEAKKSGLPYVNSAGNVVPAKRVGPNCE